MSSEIKKVFFFSGSINMKRNVTVWRVFPAKQHSREFESDDIFLDAACGLLNKEMSTNVSKQKWLIF